jgi:TPR repeat protein
MNELGVMYADGQGVGKDEAEAVRLYRKAADLGNTDAMNHLGDMYFYGRGVAKDEAKAVDLYRKAAGQRRRHI